MFKTVMGIDPGSRNTGLALKTGCFFERTRLSPGAACGMGASRSNAACIVKTGGAADRLDPVKAGEVFELDPIKNGECASPRLFGAFLLELVQKYGGRRAGPRRTELFLALPGVMPLQRVRVFEKAACLAGFSGFRVLERALMGALGAGVDIGSERVSVLVDIGAQSVTCAAVGFGGVLFECRERFGSELADRAIRGYFASEHRVMIGARVAELIKRNLDRTGFAVDGRSTLDGLPRAVNADAEPVRAAALDGSKCIARFAADMMRLLPPEACADILDTGVTLIGGGAKMHGLTELFEAELGGVRVHAAENAETAVAEGMRRFIFLENDGRSAGMLEYARMPGTAADASCAETSAGGAKAAI